MVLLIEMIKKDHPEVANGFENFNLPAFKAHSDVIRRFGRFPTRSKALGRENTLEEIQYLSNADGWGQ